MMRWKEVKLVEGSRREVICLQWQDWKKISSGRGWKGLDWSDSEEQGVTSAAERMHILVAIRKKYWIWEIKRMKWQIWRRKVCGAGGSGVWNNYRQTGVNRRTWWIGSMRKSKIVFWPCHVYYDYRASWWQKLRCGCDSQM